MLMECKNGRNFDYYDILANVLGSVASLALCNWYHKRMLERKRAARGYGQVAGDEADIELGEGFEGQESGVVRPTPTVEEELDNWDENAEDWDDTDVHDTNGGADAGDIGAPAAKIRPE